MSFSSKALLNLVLNVIMRGVPRLVTLYIATSTYASKQTKKQAKQAALDRLLPKMQVLVSFIANLFFLFFYIFIAPSFGAIFFNRAVIFYDLNIFDRKSFLRMFPPSTSIPYSAKSKTSSRFAASPALFCFYSFFAFSSKLTKVCSDFAAFDQAGIFLSGISLAATHSGASDSLFPS